MTHLVLFAALLIGSCGYALVRGGTPERIVGGALAVAALATSLALSDIQSRFMQVETGAFLVDLVLLLVLVIVALLADRCWPLLLAGLHLATVGAHFLKHFDTHMIRVTYALSVAMWSYPMLIILAVGTWRHQQRMKNIGYDRSWARALLRSGDPY